MTERGVTEIMRETRSFDDLWMDAKNLALFRLVLQDKFREPAPDLANLERVRKTRVKNVSLTRSSYLCNAREAPERRTIQDPVSVPLKYLSLIVRRRAMSSSATQPSRDNQTPALDYLFPKILRKQIHIGPYDKSPLLQESAQSLLH